METLKATLMGTSKGSLKTPYTLEHPIATVIQACRGFAAGWFGVFGAEKSSSLVCGLKYSPRPRPKWSEVPTRIYSVSPVDLGCLWEGPPKPPPSPPLPPLPPLRVCHTIYLSIYLSIYLHIYIYTYIYMYIYIYIYIHIYIYIY